MKIAIKILRTCLLLVPVSLWAADFWVAKPFTDWSEKDLQKMIANSPWAKTVSVSTGGGQGMQAGGANRRSMGEAGSGADNPAQSGGIGDDPMGNVGGGSRRGGRGGDSGAPSAPVDTTSLIVRWQTALPVKQAMVKMKYGAEATTSDEAKKMLASGADLYVVAIAGIGPRMLHGDTEVVKKALLDGTSLSVKGKDDLKPTDIQMGRSAHGMELYFVFPKKVEYSVDDKEIEFSTKFGSVSVKQKFRLKDMMFDGKLAL